MMQTELGGFLSQTNSHCKSAVEVRAILRSPSFVERLLEAKANVNAEDRLQNDVVCACWGPL